MKKTIILILVCLCFSLPGYAQLNGTLTIDPSGSGINNFKSLTEAISALNQQGTTTGVVFQIASGIYEEAAPLEIDILNNKPAENINVVFKPMPGAEVQINVNGQSELKKYAIRVGSAESKTNFVSIDGANTENGTTRNLTISAADNKYGLEPVDIYGNNITIKNCTIQARGTIYDNGTGILLRNSLQVSENCLIENNRITAINAILVGEDTLNVQKGNIIRNNELQFYLKGIYAYRVSDIIIENNKIRGDLFDTYQLLPCYGIYSGTLRNNTGTVIISGNEISNLGKNNGLTAGRRVRGIAVIGGGNYQIDRNMIHDLYNATTDTEAFQPSVFGIQISGGCTASRYNIINNAIFGFKDKDNVSGRLGTIVTAGIETTTPGDVNLYFNSIYIGETDRDNHESYALYIGLGAKGSMIKSYNNILFNNNSSPHAKSYALYRSSTLVSSFLSDFNVIYTSGAENSFTAFCGMADRKTLEEFVAVSPWDDHSISMDPGFNSENDLSLSVNKWIVNGQGMPIGEVDVDLAGNNRATSLKEGGVDIGAYQYVPVGMGKTTNVGSIGNYLITSFIGEDGKKVAEVTWMGNNFTVFPDSVQLLYTPGERAVDNTGTIINNGIDRMYSFSLPKNSGNGWTAEVKLYYNAGAEIRDYPENRLQVNRRPDQGTGGWVKEQTVIDTIDHFARFTTDHLSTFGLVDAASGVLNVDPREKGNLKYALEQNYPNPFNPSTRVKYSIAEDTKVRITVFNTLGEVVKVVLDQTQKQGNYETTIDMKGFASGIYFYQLNTERYSEVRKLVLIK